MNSMLTKPEAADAARVISACHTAKRGTDPSASATLVAMALTPAKPEGAALGGEPNGRARPPGEWVVSAVEAPCIRWPAFECRRPIAWRSGRENMSKLRQAPHGEAKVASRR